MKKTICSICFSPSFAAKPPRAPIRNAVNPNSIVLVIFGVTDTPLVSRDLIPVSSGYLYVRISKVNIHSRNPKIDSTSMAWLAMPSESTLFDHVPPKRV